ncbi:hypothetical protein AAG906_041124 [Vitis piasezkii]
MQGESVWDLVEYGWGPPLILDAQGRSTGELKPKHEWDKANNEGSEGNIRVVRKISRSLPNRFRLIVIVIERTKDIDFMRVYELAGSIQTYEMTLPNSHKLKDLTFKASKNEEKIKRVIRFNKSFYKNREFGKGKRSNEQSSNEKEKGSSKGKKVECFNFRGVGHYS